MGSGLAAAAHECPAWRWSWLCRYGLCRGGWVDTGRVVGCGLRVAEMWLQLVSRLRSFLNLFVCRKRVACFVRIFFRLPSHWCGVGVKEVDFEVKPCQLQVCYTYLQLCKTRLSFALVLTRAKLHQKTNNTYLIGFEL